MKGRSLKDAGLEGLSDEDTLHLASWIRGAAEESGRNYWIFLDGFRHLPPGNSARNLIQALADKIGNGNYRQWMRLILADYDEKLAQVDEEELVTYDLPDPAIVDIDAIEDCLRQRCAARNPPVPPSELRSRSAAILQSFNGQPADLPTLNKLLKAVARELSCAGKSTAIPVATRS